MFKTKEAIKTLVGSGKRFLIVSESSADEATLLAVIALRKILIHAGKEISFWPPLSDAFQEKFKSILPASTAINSEIPQKIKIKIPKNIPLEEMRYVEEDDGLSIIISSKESLDPSYFSIEKAPDEMDGIFCFFSHEDGEKEIFKRIQPSIAQPTPEKTLYVIGDDRTLSEKMSDIYEALHESPIDDKEIATLLLASLLYETDYMQKVRSAKVFALASSFITQGADQNRIAEITQKGNTIALAQLFGRGLARTTIDSTLKASWTFLTARDFEKTNIAPTKEILLLLLKKIRRSVPHQPISILCYEANGVRAFVFDEYKPLLASMAGRLGVETESHYFLTPPFQTFSEAEVKLRELLRDVLSTTMK